MTNTRAYVNITSSNKTNTFSNKYNRWRESLLWKIWNRIWIKEKEGNPMDTEPFFQTSYEMGRADVSCGENLYIWTDSIYEN